MGAEARPASLVRFVLLPNGEAFARFSDCSLIVLNAAAYAYALIEPDGKKTHGVCTCVRSALRPRLTAALHARNVLSPAAPRMVHDLLPPPFSESPVPTTAARHRFFDMPTSGGGGGLGSISWPRCPSPHHVMRHPDGAVRVLSLDRRAWLLLDPEGHSFYVCYPVCAGAAADFSPTRGSALASASLAPPPPPPPKDVARYVFCTQLHSAAIDPPKAWAHALDFLLVVPAPR